MERQRKKKKENKPDPPAIRLGRNSSARNVLKASEHDALKEQEEQAPGANRSKGGLPNQHALLLLQHLNKAVDEPFHPVGLSFYDKVNSVKVDNASKLLKEMSWRDFFNGKTVEEVRTEKEAKRVQQMNAATCGLIGGSYRATSPIHSHARSSQRAPSPARRPAAGAGVAAVRNHRTGKQSSHQQRFTKNGGGGGSDSENEREEEVYDFDNGNGNGNGKYAFDETTAKGFADTDTATASSAEGRGMERMQSVCVSLCARIELLWKELKISPADRDFYRQTLMFVDATRPSTHAQLMAQCAELGAYVQSLCKFRLDTIETLRAIEAREMGLQTVWELIGAKVYSAQDPRVGPSMSTEDASEIVTRKHLLVRALKHLQDCTMEVVRCVQLWRRNLWRPLPFLWTPNTQWMWSLDAADSRGPPGSGGAQPTLNYILKISTDMNYAMYSDAFIDILLSVPLCYEDLRCVLFPDTSSDAEGGGGDFAESKNTHAGRRLPLRFNPPLNSPLAAEASAAGPSGSPPRGLGLGLRASSPLRDWFRGDEASRASRCDELAAAAAVIDEEPQLLRAIIAERKVLVSNGVFIPTLRTGQRHPQAETEKPPRPHKDQNEAAAQPQAYHRSPIFRPGDFTPSRESSPSTPTRSESDVARPHREQQQRRDAKASGHDGRNSERPRDAAPQVIAGTSQQVLVATQDQDGSAITSHHPLSKEEEEQVAIEIEIEAVRRNIPKLNLPAPAPAPAPATAHSAESNPAQNADDQYWSDRDGLYEEDFL